jgi:hypothetical protein
MWTAVGHHSINAIIIPIATRSARGWTRRDVALHTIAIRPAAPGECTPAPPREPSTADRVSRESGNASRRSFSSTCENSSTPDGVRKHFERANAGLARVPRAGSRFPGTTPSDELDVYVTPTGRRHSVSREVHPADVVAGMEFSGMSRIGRHASRRRRARRWSQSPPTRCAQGSLT